MRILLLILLCVNLPAFAKVGGDWESSGGTGVACFRSVADAKAYTGKDAQIATIDTLVTLESWEAPYWSKKKIQFLEGSTKEELLALLDKNLNLTAPIFAQQMRLVKDWMHVEAYTEALRPTGDAQSKVEIPPTCRQVQLAVRLATRTATDLMPEIQVVFDPRLLPLLSPLDQALLETHERLYVLGRQVGHPDSLRIRMTTLRLFDKALWANLDTQMNVTAMQVQNLLDGQLGNYIHIFFKLMEPSETPAPYTPDARLLALRSVILKVEKAVSVCRGQDIEPCKNSILSSPNLLRQFDGPESFVFIYRWFLTAAYPDIPHSELSMVNSDDPALKALGEAGWRKACTLLSKSAGMPDESFNENLKRAQAYCSQAPGK